MQTFATFYQTILSFLVCKMLAVLSKLFTFALERSFSLKGSAVMVAPPEQRFSEF